MRVRATLVTACGARRVLYLDQLLNSISVPILRFLSPYFSERVFNLTRKDVVKRAGSQIDAMYQEAVR